MIAVPPTEMTSLIVVDGIATNPRDVFSIQIDDAIVLAEKRNSVTVLVVKRPHHTARYGMSDRLTSKSQPRASRKYRMLSAIAD
jgi:hypothetical protein